MNEDDVIAAPVADPMWRTDRLSPDARIAALRDVARRALSRVRHDRDSDYRHPSGLRQHYCVGCDVETDIRIVLKSTDDEDE